MKLQTVFFITVIRRIMDATIEKYENLPIEIDAEKRTILHKSTGDIYTFDDNVSTYNIHDLITHLRMMSNAHRNCNAYECNVCNVLTITIGFFVIHVPFAYVTCCEITVIYDIMKISFVMMNSSRVSYTDNNDDICTRIILIATKQNDVFK